MFNKTVSVEEHVEKEVRPLVEQEIEIEKKTLKPILTRQEKRKKERSDKKIMKMVNKKRLDFSFEVKTVREKIPEIEEVRNQIENGEDAIALYLKAGRIQEAHRLKKQL
jgi:hypothetical protein